MQSVKLCLSTEPHAVFIHGTFKESNVKLCEVYLFFCPESGQWNDTEPNTQSIHSMRTIREVNWMMRSSTGTL